MAFSIALPLIISLFSFYPIQCLLSFRQCISALFPCSNRYAAARWCRVQATTQSILDAIGYQHSRHPLLEKLIVLMMQWMPRAKCIFSLIVFFVTKSSAAINHKHTDPSEKFHWKLTKIIAFFHCHLPKCESIQMKLRSLSQDRCKSVRTILCNNCEMASLLSKNGKTALASKEMRQQWIKNGYRPFTAMLRCTLCTMWTVARAPFA